jgi:hypothetical protein
VEVVAREHDGLADPAAGGVTHTLVHERAPHVARGVAAEQQAVELAGFKLDRGRVGVLLFEGVLLGVVHRGVLEAGVAELAGEGDDPERREVLARQRVAEPEVRGGVALGAAEVLEGVAADELDRGGGEADLERVEVPEERLVLLVDAAVRLVGDDQVEEPDVEVLVALHHRRVGGEVDALVALVGGGGADHHPRLAGQVLLEHAIGLAQQLAAVTQEQDALGPAGAHEHVDQRDRDAGLAGAGGLDQERLAEARREPDADALDRFELVHAVGDGQLERDADQLLAVRALVDQVDQAVLGVVAVDLATGVLEDVVVEVDVEAVGAEDDRPLAGGGLQRVRVEARLLGAGLGIRGGLLGLDHGERLAVGAVQHVVGAGAVAELDLLPDLLGVSAAGTDIPAGVDELLVDQATARGQLVECQGRGDGLALGLLGLVLGVGRSDNLLGLEPLLALLGQVGEQGLIPGLGQAQLLERLSGLGVAGHVGRWRLIRWARGAVAVVDLQVEPDRDVIGGLEALEGQRRREHLLDRVGGGVPGFADGVQLLEHDLGHRLAEALIGQQVVQVLAERPGQAVGVEDVADHDLYDRAELEQRAARIGVRVGLSEATEVRDNAVARPQELEVLRLHRRHLGAKRRGHGGADPMFTRRAISRGPCTAPASWSGSGSSPGRRARRPGSCCRGWQSSRG